MKVGIFATLLLAILLAGGASADYEFHNLSEVNDRVEWADLAVSPEGMIVAAWAVREQGVWTRTVRADMLETPVFHGEGSMPTVCWAPDGFTLAWVEEGTILHSSYGDGLDWISLPQIWTQTGGTILRPQLTGALEAIGSMETYLAWEEDCNAVWVTARYGGGWGYYDMVNVPSGYGIGVKPQVIPMLDGVIRVYQLNEMQGSIDYHQGYYGSGCYSPFQIWPDTMYFGTDFDVCGGDPSNLGMVFGNGPQPVCPCNIIHLSEEQAPHDWILPQNMGVGGPGFYDWPQFPCVDKDTGSTAHLFWMEEYYDDWLEKIGTDMFYKTREPGSAVWQDQSAVLEGEVGTWCAMDIGPYDMPVFVYVKGEYPNLDLWMGRDRRLTGMPETPAAGLTLSASPNPFNPKTTLRFELPVAGPAELSIYDLSGRRVATLLGEHREAGEHIVEWNGRDDAGSRLASGVYLARATVPGYSAVEKVVMLK